MRTLLRRLVADEWRFETKRFEIDTKGVGVAVYSAIGPDIPIRSLPSQMIYRRKNGPIE